MHVRCLGIFQVFLDSIYHTDSRKDYTKVSQLQYAEKLLRFSAGICAIVSRYRVCLYLVAMTSPKNEHILCRSFHNFVHSTSASEEIFEVPACFTMMHRRTSS